MCYLVKENSQINYINICTVLLRYVWVCWNKFLWDFAPVLYIVMPRKICIKFFWCCFVLYLWRKTWKPGFLKPVETRSFHVLLKIFGFTHKKDFFTRVCRHYYGEKICKKSEKTKKFYCLLCWSSKKFWFFLDKRPGFR